MQTYNKERTTSNSLTTIIERRREGQIRQMFPPNPVVTLRASRLSGPHFTGNLFMISTVENELASGLPTYALNPKPK